MSATPSESLKILQTAPPAPDFIQGGGEMGALMRAHDWRATPLGSPETWPQPLRTALRLLLNSGHPMYIYWGPELLCFYNDAYRPSIGPERHPGSLGRPAREVWAEIWSIIGADIGHVMSGGGASWHENALVPITRNGRREDVYWTYSHSPIDDANAANGIGGVLVVCTETTGQVLSAQRATEERERFAQLFEQAPSFMAMLRGPEHRFELLNPAYRRLIGNRDVLGHTVAEALPEAAAQGYVGILDRVYRRGEPYAASGAKFIARVGPGGGPSERYLDFVYQPIKDASGAVVAIFVDGADVTARTLSEAALRESEARFRAIADATPVLIWISDITKTCTWFNSRWLIFTGRSMEQETGYGWMEGVHPQDHDRCVAVYGRAFDRRESYRTEYRRRRSDGEWRILDASGVPRFVDGEFVGFIGCCIDVTDQRAAERELRRLNETLEQRVATALKDRKVFGDMIESSDSFVQVLDLNYGIMAINRAMKKEWQRAYGVEPKVDDNLLELLKHRPEDRAALKTSWSRALQGEDFTVLDKFDDSHPDRRLYERKFNTLRDVKGGPVGAFQFVYDVTERLRDQARLAEAEAHLRQSQKIEAIGQLTGGVAHDFNNLLMVITGGLSVLERSNEPERRQRVMSGMRQAADRGASLSRQLLAFSRRQPLKAETVDLRRQLDGMRELLDRTLRGDVQVQTDLALDLWPINVDSAELELAFLNLCVNARDAMPAGGVITITAKNAPHFKQGPLAGEFVSVSVTDTGTGMSPEVLAHVFEPFFTTKDIGKGSGLGLPQVYGFARQSGGSVRVNSTVGSGTTVTLVLPRTHAVPVPRPTATDLDTTAKRRSLAGSILLVEDDDEVAALVTDMLQELGYWIIRAASAQSALGALADDRNVSLVFSDIMMPGSMNGMDLAKEIKRRRPGLPILLTTGYAGDILKSAEAENIDVLRKPYQIQALDAAIRSALRHQRR